MSDEQIPLLGHAQHRNAYLFSRGYGWVPESHRTQQPTMRVFFAFAIH